jgi:hypothetical protein
VPDYSIVNEFLHYPPPGMVRGWVQCHKIQIRAPFGYPLFTGCQPEPNFIQTVGKRDNFNTGRASIIGPSQTKIPLHEQPTPKSPPKGGDFEPECECECDCGQSVFLCPESDLHYSPPGSGWTGVGFSSVPGPAAGPNSPGPFGQGRSKQGHHEQAEGGHPAAEDP